MPITKELNSKNGTLSINQQTNFQRNAFSSSFDGKGAASNNAEVLFPDSPIYVDNRSTEEDDLNDRGNLFGTSDNIYNAYSKVIDPSDNTGVNGFGFSNTNKAFMNYRHSDNPFLDENNIDYNALTSGGVATENDNASSKKRYLGFPDPKPNSIDSPADASAAVATEGIYEENVKSKNNNFGNSESSYREKISNDSLLGIHIALGQGNGDTETLGKYFLTKHNSDSIEDQ